jgi:hypothetical protein
MSGQYARNKLNGILLNVVLLIFGPALILIGLHALPPQWRPGLHWPIGGERAAASVESVHLALRHVDNDPRIDNVQGSINVALAYQDRAGKTQRAQLAGPWLLQEATQWTGDAAWFYLEDIARGIGMGPLEVDMPRDVAAQLEIAHDEFTISEQTAANLDRPLRWVALNWIAPEQALAVRFDPLQPTVAIPEFVIERESTRLQGAGFLRALAFVLGCILVGGLAWNVFAFRSRIARALATLLVIGSVLQWSPYVSTLVRWVAPGIDTWSGLDIDEVVADPLSPFYDEFRAGPSFVAVKTTAPLQGVAWTPSSLSEHNLVHWLRSVPIVAVRGSIDEAENALTHAAKGTLAGIGDDELRAIDTELATIAARRYWIGTGQNYVDLRDAVRAELERRTNH